MPHWQYYLCCISILGCSISGMVFLIGHEFDIQKELIGKHTILMGHGVLAMFVSISFGAILPVHIKAGWHAKKNRISGIFQLLLLSILCITALLLYYGTESIREINILIHWIIGLIFFLIFLTHMFLKKWKSSN